MTRCAHCSAPLPAWSGVCAYCGGANEADRSALAGARATDREARYPCPVCSQSMRPLEVAVGAGVGKRIDGSKGGVSGGIGGIGGIGATPGQGGNTIVVDKCGLCFGLFFPAYGLETLLAEAARFGDLVDVRRLAELERHAPAETAVAYRKCPVCAKIMNRVNFGSRSGVVTDRCRDHGVWLDAGELRRLLEWKGSGGAILEAERRSFLEREADRKRRRDAERTARWRAQGGNADG